MLHLLEYLAMLPLVAIGVLWGLETAFAYWVRWATQRPGPV